MELYLMNDQPITCSICGARTSIISVFYHTNIKLFINECLDIKCNHVFLKIEPES